MASSKSIFWKLELFLLLAISSLIHQRLSLNKEKHKVKAFLLVAITK
jgi:hypothetical protein